MGANSVTGTAEPSGAHELTLVISGVRIAQSLVFCVVFCRSLFVLFRLAIVLHVLRFTTSDNPVGIFRPFLQL